MRAKVVRAAVSLPLVVVMSLLGGCVGQPPVSNPAGVDGLDVPTPSPDPGDFVVRIDNPWFPLEPGTVWSFEESVGPQTDVSSRVVTVTDDTREVAGVTTTVVHDVTTDPDGVIVEDSYDWYAQDRLGNVWSFGEDTTTYDDDGETDRSDSWEAGVDGAQAGLVMPARPRLGDGFQQGYLPGVVEGRATVLSVNEVRTVAAGAFTSLVQTQETSPLDPGVIGRKYYARGVGLVYEEIVAGDRWRGELLYQARPE